MKKSLSILAIALTLSSASASAQLLIDTSIPENPISVGVRLGITESTISNNLPKASEAVSWAETSWGTGFTVGAVADLAIRNYIAVQPGFFIQMRNAGYTNMLAQPAGFVTYPYDEEESGSVRSCNINIPVLASFRVNLSPLLQARAEAGPYFQFGLGGRTRYDITSVVAATDGDLVERIVLKNQKRDTYGDKGYLRSYDWGFKLGVAFEYGGRYSLGIHYMAGARNCIEQQRGTRRALSGHNKAWDFTIGYTL